MQIIRHESDLEDIADHRVQALIQSRIEQIEEEDFFDADIYGQFVVVEPGDALAELERETVTPLLSERPCFESLLDHGAFFDVVWSLAGDQVVTLIVPKLDGIPDELLNLCERYASTVGKGAEL